LLVIPSKFHIALLDSTHTHYHHPPPTTTGTLHDRGRLLHPCSIPPGNVSGFFYWSGLRLISPPPLASLIVEKRSVSSAVHGTSTRNCYKSARSCLIASLLKPLDLLMLIYSVAVYGDCVHANSLPCGPPWNDVEMVVEGGEAGEIT